MNKKIVIIMIVLILYEIKSRKVCARGVLHTTFEIVLRTSVEVVHVLHR